MIQSLFEGEDKHVKELVAAHGFLIGHVYDFRAGSQSIKIPIPQLRRPPGRLLLMGNIADRFEIII